MLASNAMTRPTAAIRFTDFLLCLADSHQLMATSFDKKMGRAVGDRLPD
jgi:hypothetical protein